MPLIRLLLTLLLAVVLLPARAAEIEGQHFDDRIRLADTELLLNGTGLRAVAWLKGYAAGLYLPEKVTSADAVLVQKGAKRLRMKMMVEVEAKEFVKAFDKGMRRNLSEAERAPLRERMERFDRSVSALVTLKKGDVVDLDYLPGRGLLLSVNGKLQGEPYEGETFYTGVLKIFIGGDPVDKKLKAGLLGQS
ncbi:MAG: chalcone isomerase family protein [Piscinibacter sp.]